MDPFEKARHTNRYHDWYARRIFMLGWAGSYVMQFKKTLKEFPPAQKPATWNATKVGE